jgi:hypothetical protein
MKSGGDQSSLPQADADGVGMIDDDDDDNPDEMDEGV